MTTQTLYEKDFNLWIEQTINDLKNGDLTNLDRENLIEEIQSMGNSDKRETFSRLKVLIMHLLKWKYQPEKRYAFHKYPQKTFVYVKGIDFV